MDVYDKIDELTAVVERARAVPMSASCVVHRGDVLALLDEIRELLPAELREAQAVLAERDALLRQAGDDAARILEEARAERDRLVEETEVHAAAVDEAARVREHAAAEAAQMRRETDEYVEAKLSQFEITLTKTLAAVHRGRERLTAGGSAAEDSSRDLSADREPGVPGT